ncbi:predicted protein [Postia placenta Mad-698-R]|uniref:USP domain-containing protein n=1 Tax=Postia placenta MAD-698-R-SB12 TaxID=670580 RepID=A0A1X6N4Y5_9APHY|nr:hypothetical protein POSPLADRAFT_1045805 [Postia placenta MAD-698-R-SB12]EED84907.1 predicted protein [Postia placenta Mad-698-R]OSX63483.1 hypothetical protein POSPLADRAFT_1045805 [Postia placenta MAD-698-R-SB12]
MIKRKHQPTPQDLYKARKQREEEEKEANLPPGLINHGNTCFMNSTLQGLMATELLHNLVFFEPIPPSVESKFGGSIIAHRSPQLTNGHGLAGQFEHQRVDEMPLGDVFVDVMRKAWDIQQSHRRETMSPKELLFTMGRKYDQYLDFRQQDAHEFLRHMLDAMRMEEQDIIKQRQPPPPKESRKRGRKHRKSDSPVASTSTADGSSSTNGPPSAPEEQLVSFVDMIFGGHLASILVCEKCKKVSLTYEEFNDLSLSIKPEDYAKGRKRDRFKRFARKLRGPFRPASGSTQRSSSVPADRARRSLETEPHEEEPPVNEGPRRKSFDHVAEGGEAEAEMNEVRDVVEGMTRQTSPRLSTAVEDQEVSPEGSEGLEGMGKERGSADDEAGHEKGKARRKDKDKVDPWGRFGRRLSVSVKKGMKALDPGSPTRSVERGRKGQPKDRDEARTSKDSERESHPRTQITAAQAQDSGSDMSDPDVSRLRSTSSPLPIITSPLANPPISAPTRPEVKPGTTFGGRKKPPHAPKPSRQEQAYLRQLLADVHASNANPFSVLHHVISDATHGTPPAAAAQAAWAKLGHLPGIEECLRMFTSVEILDGENMVGCHRCWKIAHGKYKPERQGVVADDDDDDDAGSNGEGTASSPSDQVLGDKLPEAVREPPMSPSSETLSSSPDANGYISPASTPAIRSVTSFSDTMSDATSMTAPTTMGSVTATIEKASYPPLVSPTRPTTYGGLPIPSISTTGPESPVATSRRSPIDKTGEESSDRRSDSPLGVSPSDDSLLTPKPKRRSKAGTGAEDMKSDSSDDEYDSDSDVSGSTSVYSGGSSVASAAASPVASPRASVENVQTVGPTEKRPKLAPSDPSSAKVSRSRQVILRRMYKRYLIADPPPILVVHLKRFQQTGRTHTVTFTGGVKKLDEFVSFPEYLDVAPYLAPRREDFGLDDKATRAEAKEAGKDARFVVHIGNMLGGHYVAYTALPPSHPLAGSSKPGGSSGSDTPSAHKPSIEIAEGVVKPPKPHRQWAYISDTVVRLTTLEEVLKAKAYICGGLLESDIAVSYT